MQVIDISYLIRNRNRKELSPEVPALNSEKFIDKVMLIELLQSSPHEAHNLHWFSFDVYFFFVDINTCFIIKRMTFVYLPFFTTELKILHLPSLLLPVLFHFTFTHFIYRNWARQDREDFSCTTARWACVDRTDVARTILTVESSRKS